MSKTLQKYLRPKLIFFTVILVLILLPGFNSNIWDNILSQGQASYPIMPTQSFNFQFDLPEQFGKMQGNIDFNSKLNLITLKLLKNIIITNMQLFKAQIDLNTLIVSTESLMLSCQRFKINTSTELDKSITSNIENTKISKSYLFLMNLLFKYLGTYEMKKEGIFGKKQLYNKWQFSYELLDLEEIGKDVADGIKDRVLQDEDEMSADEYTKQSGFLEDFDVTDIDLSILKFILITDRNTGQIIKAFKNNEMKQQLELNLKSEVKQKLQCKSEVKILTYEEMKQGAKYLYDNKDSLENLIKI